MNAAEFLGGFLTTHDITRPQKVTFKRFDKQKIADDPKSKLVGYFEELPKGLVFNATNIKLMMKLTKSSNTDDWVGKQVILYKKTDVEFRGDLVEGLRLRPADEVGSAENVARQELDGIAIEDTDFPFD